VFATLQANYQIALSFRYQRTCLGVFIAMTQIFNRFAVIILKPVVKTLYRFRKAAQMIFILIE
jgi:hypothetical protein